MTIEFQNTFADHWSAQKAHFAAAHPPAAGWIVPAVATAWLAGMAATWHAPADAVSVAAGTAPSLATLWHDVCFGGGPPVAIALLVVPTMVGIVRPNRRRFVAIDRAGPAEAAVRWLTRVALVVIVVVATADPNRPRPWSDRLVDATAWLGGTAFVVAAGVGGVRRAARKNALQSRQTSLDADDDRVVVVNDLNRSELRWPAFVRCVDAPDLFLLYVSDRSLFPIPKRAFATDEDLRRFRDLVRHWAERPRAAFPVVRPSSP